MGINFILIRQFKPNHMLKCLIHCVLVLYTIVKVKIEAILGFLRRRQAQILEYQQSLGWKEIRFHNKSYCPQARWGQAMTSIGSDLLLFGGYTGSDFLKRLWFFDNQRLKWNKMKPEKINQIEPQARSCSSLHFHQQSNNVILFGGGNKQQFYNDVYFMNWKGLKKWEKIHVQQGNKVPSVRTYHSSNLIDKYLIIFGGYCGYNLNDLWAFDIELHVWTQIKGKNGQSPKARQFHSSSILKEKLFLFGGQMQNQKLIQHIQFVDLRPFLLNKTDQLRWMYHTRTHCLLERWGHSSVVVNESIILFGGRIKSSTSENAQFIHSNQIIRQFKIQNNQDKYSTMRRRSFVVVGNCIVAFGGFDSSDTYNNCFQYLSLDNLSLGESKSSQKLYPLNPLLTPKLQSDFQSQILLNNLNIYLQQIYFNHNKQKGELISIKYQDYKQLQERIYLFNSNITKIVINNQQYNIKAQRANKISDYFKNHFRYDKQILSIQLQNLSISAVVVCINYINTECPIICDDFSLDILLEIALLSAYLALEGLTNRLQYFLCEMVDINSCDKLFTFSYNINFNILFKKCLYFMFKVYIGQKNILKAFPMPLYQVQKAEKFRKDMEIELRQIKMYALGQ